MRGQIAVVTGGTRGFGHAIAEALLRSGATVVISGRSDEAIQRAMEKLKVLGPVSGCICDVREAEQVYALARRSMDQHGRMDVWINNAGYSASAGLMIETPPEQVVDMFLANNMGMYYGTQAALHYMLERKQGTLVNIYGNGSFLNPASPTGMYGASKAWVASFTRSLSTEMRGSGVRLLGFSPGMLLTDMLTAPKVIGEWGRRRMKNYGFVLQFLAGSPQRAAERLVRVLEGSRKEFAEYRMFKPWTPFVGLARVAFERLTRTGKSPEFELTFEPAYRPKI